MKNFLRQIPIFSGLDDDELDFLARVASQREYPKDSYIIREDEPGLSLFIVRSGVVDVILEQPDATPVTLSTLRSHEFFGEMSLFDGKPRSATVVAREHSTIVEITRDILLTKISKHPDIALKILAQMSQRIRRSDEIVKQFADRIYGDVSQKFEDKLAVELDSVKTLYKATEDRASKTLDGVEESWKRLWRLITIIVGVFTVFASAIAFLGYGRYAEIKKIWEEAKTAQVNINQIESYAQEAAILREIMLNIRKIREDTKLDLPDLLEYELTDDEIKYMSINTSLSRRELFEKYIDNCETSAPQVCLEAVLTFLDLKQKGELKLKKEESDKLGRALINVIERSSEKDWRTQLRARDELIRFNKEISSEYQHYITRQLNVLVKNERLKDHVRFNSALVLAQLDTVDDNTKMLLEWYRTYSEFEWRRNQAAVALIQMNEKQVWTNLSEIIHKDDHESFIVAFLLGQLGRTKLVKLGVKILKNNNEDDSINLIINRLQEGSRKYYRNKFMIDYCNRIIKKKLK